jgi:hypothetical protein
MVSWPFIISWTPHVEAGMNKLQKPSERRQASDRRQFGRRWTQAHGWICIEGRPKLSCVVQNFSETGALLEVVTPNRLPKHFILAIDTIDFRMGCEVMRELPGALGVKFCPISEMAEAISASSKAELSTYERLLALANTEHEAQEEAEAMHKQAKFVNA